MPHLDQELTIIQAAVIARSWDADELAERLDALAEVIRRARPAGIEFPVPVESDTGEAAYPVK